MPSFPIYDILQTISIVLLVMYAGMLFYLLHGWKKIAYIRTPPSAAHTPVSVIVPVRNEEENITGCLRSLLAQDYPVQLLEIILADDHSGDRTIQYAKHLIAQNRINVKIVYAGEHEFGKKAAIAKAAGMSSGKLLITTDADCRHDPHWVSTMVSCYETANPKMIAAPVFFKNDGGWFSGLQSLEMVALTSIAGGAIQKKMPLMCNGANLAYEKSVFDDLGGFDGNKETLTGDDTFLMMKIHARHPGGICFLKSLEATVYTTPLPGFQHFFNQRKRWASKTFLYKSGRVASAGVVVYLANFCIPLTAALSFADIRYARLCALLFIVKAIADLIFIYPPLSFFKRKDLLLLFLPAQVVYPLYVTVTGLLSLVTSYQWKGRSS